jgi:hypothetical protein
VEAFYVVRAARLYVLLREPAAWHRFTQSLFQSLSRFNRVGQRKQDAVSVFGL